MPSDPFKVFWYFLKPVWLQIWSVLTNYTKLASFVPNLEHCERVAGAPPGRQRLLQRASSQSIFCRIQAEAVLDVREVILALDRRELHFTMVSGDFQVCCLGSLSAQISMYVPVASQGICKSGI